MTQDMSNKIMTRGNIVFKLSQWSGQSVPMVGTKCFNDGNKVFPCWEQLRTLILFLMVTLGSTTVWGQVDITTDENSNGVIDNSEKKLYLIQTNGFQSFYMAPKTISGTLRIMTNNILGDYMLWYFLDAGTVSGTQYYYIVSYTENKYICHGGGTDNNTRTVSLVEKDASNEERCKFYLVLDESNGTTGFYNIDAKGKPSFYGLNKQNGSQNKDNPVRLTNDQYIHDFNSKWKFIRYNGTFTWPDPPFTPSTDSDKHYYEIHNIQKDYYASTDGTPDKVTFTNQATERRTWYFKEASSDSWYQYYYIINPSTGGKYMYYNGTATNGNNQTNAVSVKDYDSSNEDRYQFVVVQAARGDFESNKDTRVECYAIIPKLLLDKTWGSNSLGLAEGSITDGANMGIISNRGVPNGAHWKFDTTVFTTECAHPVISFDNTTGKATISTTTSWPSIHYTTDGTTVPSSTNGTLYEEPFSLTEQTTIKAIVTKDGYTDSEVTTTTIDKVATPTIQDNGSHAISITSATPDATIYYTIDGTDPTTSSIPYTGPSEELSGKNIRAIAVKNGMINSDIGSGSISIKCATPVISFNNATLEVTITCETEGSTIYYTTDGTTTPSASSTPYNGPFSVTSPTTVKAIATHAGLDPSSVAELVISQVATPTIQNNGSNAISITSATSGATIYYTTDGSTPTTGSTPYTSPLTENVSNVTIKAIAVKENMITSAVGSGSVKLKCAAPVVTRDGMSFTLSCSMPTDATLYYTIGSGSETQYNNSPVTFTSDQLPVTVTAVARHSDYYDSDHTSLKLTKGEGTASSPYLIYGASDFTNFVTNVNNGTTADKCYLLCTDVSASGIGAIIRAYTGTFDGGGYTISNLGHALFNSLNGGTVKNVMLDNVSISSGTNVGAICNEATGASRIYNCGVLATGSTVTTNDDGYTEITSCSSTISGSNYVGGIVGLLDGSSRVINCFSYAEIKGGNYVGGIVGYNNVATNANSEDTDHYLKTMVMNCMFYGDITGGTYKAPIYNGKIITNRGDDSGVSNFNYFWGGASYVTYRGADNNPDIQTYNCALMAETRFLQRFEFFRHVLNGHRELAAWWATGSADNKDLMMKWVLEPSQIGTSTPYPILKTPDRYPSVVNIDVNHSETYNGRDLTVGPKLGNKLSVTIRNSTTDAVYGAPTGADITTTSLSLNIMDKDPDHFNFNYGKVQLPYYNDVGTGNYTQNKVVTGWKIVSVGGVEGEHTFSTGTMPADATATVTDGDITLTTPYNYADRKCTQKDVYETNGHRIFNQGAYFDVPEGVTSITIEPYWAKCVYVADAYPDVVYNKDMGTSYNVTTVGGGQRYENGKKYNLVTHSLDETNGQIVYTSIGNSIASSGSALFSGVDANNHSVYDYAVVLVGNYHHYYPDSDNKRIEASNSKPYTITSIDLDGDNEPDYSYIMRLDKRQKVHPVRIDFLNVIGLGMAQKSHEGTGTYNFGIMQPKGWFECTNTGLFRVTQLEYDQAGRTESPMILHGGVIEQWVAAGQTESSAKEAKAVSYYHVGGNVWFKEFHIGVHQDKTQDEFVSPHPPISVTGGDYDIFYLTGYYNSPNNNYSDNAECYINGGRFGKVAGTGMQGLGKTGGADNTGNIIWQIDNADIDEFYAGGMNAAHIAEGNIWTVISNSRVDQFCGGPKFGDMNSNKIVVTNAKNCTFRTFFGAGYGGNSYNRRYPANQNDKVNINWNAWLTGTASYDYSYDANYGGVETRFDYQFIPMSGNTTNVARLIVEHVSFSLATTHNVTTKLTDCTITKSHLGRLDISDDDKRLGNFYGGGSLGKVAGPVKTTLTNCTVEGNVFGAGYSASTPTVSVMARAFQTEPRYNQYLGAYLDAVLPATTTYTWEHADTVYSTGTAINTNTKQLFTTEDLSKSSLGAINGNVTLTLNGTTKVGYDKDGNPVAGGGNVYGGGDASAVTGSGNKVTVNLEDNTKVLGNVFGGGNEGPVEGSTEVNIGAAPAPAVTPTP